MFRSKKKEPIRVRFAVENEVLLFSSYGGVYASEEDVPSELVRISRFYDGKSISAYECDANGKLLWDGRVFLGE